MIELLIRSGIGLVVYYVLGVDCYSKRGNGNEKDEI